MFRVFLGHLVHQPYNCLIVWKLFTERKINSLMRIQLKINRLLSHMLSYYFACPPLDTVYILDCTEELFFAEVRHEQNCISFNTVPNLKKPQKSTYW